MIEGFIAPGPLHGTSKQSRPALSLIIPTYNPGDYARRMLAAIECQTLQPDEILVVDSSSTDGSIAAFAEIGAAVERIPQSTFDHGGTRNYALRKSHGDFVLFMTQDAIPSEPESIEKLVSTLQRDARVGVAYGRQIAHEDVNPFADHIRQFNYPAVSEVRDRSDLSARGIRAGFCSNCFAVYRREALDAVGLFPDRVILAEDMWAATAMLLEGWSVAYVAEAVVWHSHDYGVSDEFRLLFDTGVAHAQRADVVAELGSPIGEGIRFAKSEWRYLSERGVRGAPIQWLARNSARWFGYQLGLRYRLLPLEVRRRLSMWRGFWTSENR